MKIIVDNLYQQVLMLLILTCISDEKTNMSFCDGDCSVCLQQIKRYESLDISHDSSMHGLREVFQCPLVIFCYLLLITINATILSFIRNKVEHSNCSRNNPSQVCWTEIIYLNNRESHSFMTYYSPYINIK